MGRRRCCCFGSCIVFADDFTDDASTTLDPSKWTEERGDWEYDGTTFLEENGTVDASVLTVAETATNEQYVSTTIALPISGRKYRLIFNAVDEQNYHFVEWEVVIPNVIRWYKRTGGGNTLLRTEIMEAGEPDATDVTFSVCSNSISSTVEFAPSPPGQFYYNCDPGLFPNGRRAGLGNGTAAAIKFDDFNLQDYRGDDGVLPADFKCCGQQCQCTEGGRTFCIPHVLTATLSATGGCESLDGNTFDMVYFPPLDAWESYDSSIVHHTGDSPADIGTAGAHPVCADGNFWIMTCGGSFCAGPLGIFSLSNRLTAGGCSEFDDCISIDDPELSYSCNPTVIIFPIEGYAAFEVTPPVCQCCDSEVTGSVQLILTEQ